MRKQEVLLRQAEQTRRQEVTYHTKITDHNVLILPFHCLFLDIQVAVNWSQSTGHCTQSHTSPISGTAGGRGGEQGRTGQAEGGCHEGRHGPKAGGGGQEDGCPAATGGWDGITIL